jgi:hypothetical protein
MDASGDCHMGMYLKEGLSTDLVIATSTGTCTLDKDYGRIWLWLPQPQMQNEGMMDGFGDCHKNMYIRKWQWTDLVIVTSTCAIGRDYGRIWWLPQAQVQLRKDCEGIWWLPKAHVHKAGTVDGSGDCHKHRYIQKRLWTDLVITTIISKLGRDYGRIWWLPQAQVQLGRDYGRIWWLPKANVHKARTVDGSGDCHKHRYIQKKLWTELVIAQA